MMKKFVATLAVLAMAATVSAGTLTVSATDNLDGTCTISYSTSDPAPVGMALNVDCTSGQVEGVAVDSFFDIYMDDAYDMESGTPGSYSYGDGEPIALQVGPGGDDLPSANFCISMGGLGGETTPGPSSGDAEGDIVLSSSVATAGSITLNQQRGGVVYLNGDAMDIATLPLAFTITPGGVENCMQEAGIDVSDPDLYAEWEDAGMPECWCYPTQCKGDADGLKEGVNPTYGLPGYYVGVNDIDIVSDAWQVNPVTGNQGCADFDHAREGVNPTYGLPGYRVGVNDIDILSLNWQDEDLVGDCSPGNRTP